MCFRTFINSHYSQDALTWDRGVGVHGSGDTGECGVVFQKSEIDKRKFIKADRVWISESSLIRALSILIISYKSYCI